MPRTFSDQLSRSNIWRFFVRRAPLLTICLGLFELTANAAILSWSGGGGANANWNNSANWGFAGTPNNGDILIFSASQPNLLNTNNISGLTLNQIRFVGAGGGYDIRGSAFTLTNNIEATNSAGANTIENNIALAGADQIVDVTVSLTLSGILSGSVGLVKNGAGTLVLNGPFSNTYGGTTTVNGGLVQLSKNGNLAAAIPGDLVIGNGSTATTVQNTAGFEIVDTANITINNNGHYDLNGNVETVGTNLTLNGTCSILVGAGTLTLSAPQNISVNGTCNITGAGSLNLAAGPCGINVASGSLSIYPSVQGAAAITKTGQGYLYLYGANTYSGLTTLSQGWIWAANSLALGATNSGTVVSNGATLVLIGGLSISNESLTLNGQGEGGWASLDCENLETNIWAGPIILNADSTFGNYGGGTLRIIGPISGAGGATEVWGGVLTFEGTTANSYAGTTTVSVGNLLLGKPFAVTAVPGPLVVAAGRTVRLLQSFQIYTPATKNSVLLGDSSLLDLAGFSDWVGPINMQGAQITTGAGTLYLNNDITVNSSSAAQSVISGNAQIVSSTSTITITNSGHNYSPDLNFSANLSSGAGQGLVKTGSGEVSLAGNNTFVGPVTINAGSLWATTATALGNVSAPVTVNSGGTLFLDGGVLDFGLKPLVLNGSGYALGAIQCNGACTWGGTNTLASDSIININPSSSLNLTGLVTGPGGFSKVGPGTLTLSGTNENNYAGTTAVNEGLLQLNHSANHAIGTSSALTIGDGVGGADVDIVSYINTYGNQINGSIPVTINSSGLLDLNGQTDDVGPFTLSGGDIHTGSGLLIADFGNFNVLATASKQSIISGNLEMFGNSFIVDNSGALYDLQIPANVSDSATGFKIINGATPGGFVRLTGSNSFAGPLTISGLRVTAETPWALGTTAGATFVTNSGELFLYATGITNETVNLAAGTTFTAQKSCTWNGPVVLGGNATINNFGSAGIFDIVGPISGTGNLTSIGITNRFSGSAPNTFAGTTIVSSGYLTLNKTIFTTAVPGNIIISNGAALSLANFQQTANTADVLINSGGLFDFTAYNAFIDTLHGAGTINFGVGGWIQVGANNGTSQFDGSFSGGGYSPGYTVGKAGTGTFTMTGNSTYAAGIMEVIGGKLVINGAQPLIPVAVDVGATLGGTGTVGPISVSGTVAPGSSPGILNSSNVTFAAGGNLRVDLTGATAGTGYDQLNVTGTNTLANAALTVIPAFATTPAIGQQYTILNNDGADAITGTFNGLPNGTQFTAGGYAFRINYTGGTGNDVVLTLLGIPGNTVTVNAVDQGWYDSTGFHNPGNKNYLAGNDSTISNTNLFRNFFVFNVPVSTNAIVHAELFINDYQNFSSHGQETYLLRKVTTPIATLEAGGSGLVGIYADLGTGAVYSVRSIATNEYGQKSIIPLNVKFINEAAAASGGQLAVGGSIITLDSTNNHNQRLFGFSGLAADDVQLRLTYGTNLVITSANRGWYNNLGNHTASSGNYLAGDDGVNLFRNFFVFNLPAISSQLVDAQLLLNSYTNVSPDGVETYQLYDVTNAIIVLTNNASGATSIYADLGNGAVYGGRDVYVSESGQTASIPLNGNFLNDTLTHSGGKIALGGALTTLNPALTTENLFGFSSASVPADAQLWLGFLTAPVAHPSFVSRTPTYLGTNQFQFTVSGAAGTTNEIQGSFDFQRWDYITDLKMTGTTNSFIYTNTAAVPYRFFRAEQLQ